MKEWTLVAILRPILCRFVQLRKIRTQLEVQTIYLKGMLK